MTPSRKIDRNALAKADASIEAGTVFVAARTDVERAVAGLFAETLTLDVDRVSVEDSLFELGGHSLDATSILAKVEGVFGAHLELRQFFREPTVAATAATLTSDPTTRSRVERIAQLRVKLDSMSADEISAMLSSKRAGADRERA
jgi:acyl carrier protein